MKEFQPARRLRGIQKSLIRQIFDRARPGSINLGLGEPDLETPAVIRDEAERVIRQEQNGYTMHAGLPALRERIAGDYEFLDGDRERVLVTVGSQEALYLALMTIVDEGDEVLLPDPGFVAYPAIVRMAGGTPVFYRLPRASGFSFDAEDFRRRLTPRTRAVVIISPSNPTGRVLADEDLAAIAAALEGTGVYVVSDEIYRELYFTSARPRSISEYYGQTVVVSGLSKSMSMTGWRLGWLCGAAEVVRSALVLHGYTTTCTSTVTQKASLASWTKEAEDARRLSRETFGARRHHLLALVEAELGLRAVAPEGAFYTMVDVSRYADSMRVAERCLEHGVITVPGVAFGTESEGYLRLSFCADEEKLTEGIGRIRGALESLTNAAAW